MNSTHSGLSRPIQFDVAGIHTPHVVMKIAHDNHGLRVLDKAEVGDCREYGLLVYRCESEGGRCCLCPLSLTVELIARTVNGQPSNQSWSGAGVESITP
jgi:hypothetical protein